MMSKTTPKKRQSTPKTTTIVKTRQQPGRRAKGSARIPIDSSKTDTVESGPQLKENESNKTSDVLDSSQKNTDSIGESVITTDLSSKSIEQTVRSVADSIIDGLDTQRSDQSQRMADNSDLIQQTNETDVNQNLIEVSNPNQLTAVTTEEHNQISDNRLVMFKNPIVITSMIDEQNPSLNSSPLQENGTKYSDLQRI